MADQALRNLLKEDQHQVFLFTCPATPWLFARHPWFIVNKKGELSRWEIVGIPRRKKLHWGHIYRDVLSPYVGIGMILPLHGPFWEAKLAGYVEGEDAVRMAACIEHSKETYPHRDRYVLTGPNSNTFPQWVLNQFPDCDMKLPWNAFGKGYL